VNNKEKKIIDAGVSGRARNSGTQQMRGKWAIETRRKREKEKVKGASERG